MGLYGFISKSQIPNILPWHIFIQQTEGVEILRNNIFTFEATQNGSLNELFEHEINKFSERRISDKLWQTGNIFHSFNFTKFLTSKYVGFEIA